MTSSSRKASAGSSARGRLRGVARLRDRLTVAIAVAALGLAASGCASVDAAAPPSSRPGQAASPSASPSASPTTAPEPPEAAVAPAVLGEGVRPASVRIPSIDLDERLIDLGIKADGTMGVPNDWDAVGWFTGGGKPGGRGPTVIAGHVDSVSAPAVFFRLDELVPGDSIEVTDIDGVVVSYTVSEVADYPKAEFPTARVFGAIPGDELRLITCGGFFDPAAASYEDNRVVFAVRS